MNRREFFKASLAGLVVAAIPKVALAKTQDERNGKIFKGTVDGRIMESSDDGRNWQLNMDFGPDISIVNIYRKGQEVYANLRFREHGFNMKLNDDSNWCSN